MGGATVIDPFEHLDGGERQENTAPWRPDPARAEPGGATAELKLQLSDEDETPQGGGRPVSLEELKALLERGGDLRISEAQGRIEEGLGLYITDLLGKIPAEQLRELREKIASGDAVAIRAWLARQAAGTSFYYDEWDHRIGDYRRRWCRVTESFGDEDAGEFFNDALARSGELVGRIKRDFQLLRPDQLRRVPRAEQGEEFDLNALVEAHSDRRGRRTPSDRLYIARKPEERDVATLFLIDMSASTDEPLPDSGPAGSTRRVIDLTKDTLAVLAQVLGEIGDSYAIYGFSGHGRGNVEIYHIKSFSERLSDKVKGRLGGIAPKRSTRMGAALRHAGEKLARTTARSRHLILLSDGFPQDFDYGDDRRSNVYGIRDTLQALRELEKRGMQTFCITVDPAGHDYLGEMCPSSRYAVIDDIHELPSELGADLPQDHALLSGFAAAAVPSRTAACQASSLRANDQDALAGLVDGRRRYSSDASRPSHRTWRRYACSAFVPLNRTRRIRRWARKNPSKSLGSCVACSMRESRLPSRRHECSTSQSAMRADPSASQPLVVRRRRGDVQHRRHDRPERVARMRIILAGGQRGGAGHAAENQDLRFFVRNAGKAVNARLLSHHFSNGAGSPQLPWNTNEETGRRVRGVRSRSRSVSGMSLPSSR